MQERESGQIAVYLVESAKGLVSIRELPIQADRHLVVMLGQFSFPSHAWPQPTECIEHKSPFNLNECQMAILRSCKGSRINLIFTDDTFNEMSFSIYKALKPKKTALVLLDHLHYAGITYKTHATFKAFIRFRRHFLRNPLSFRPIIFSNGVTGYRLNINFHETKYFSGGFSKNLLKVAPEKKILLLVPLHYSKAYIPYLRFIEALLTTSGVGPGRSALSRIAYKMHPRRSEKDLALLNQYATLKSCAEFDASVPLELYDLSGFTVINLDSSVGPLNGAKVVLLAHHFGYTSQETSNMSGTPCQSLEEIERLLDEYAVT